MNVQPVDLARARRDQIGYIKTYHKPRPAQGFFRQHKQIKAGQKVLPETYGWPWVSRRPLHAMFSPPLTQAGVVEKKYF